MDFIEMDIDYILCINRQSMILVLLGFQVGLAKMGFHVLIPIISKNVPIQTRYAAELETLLDIKQSRHLKTPYGKYEKSSCKT